MKIQTRWLEKMKFVASVDGNETLMDAKSPIGTGSAMTPKELVVAGMVGCSAIDVMAYMRKHRLSVKSLEVEAEVKKSKGVYPEVFTQALLTFKLQGEMAETQALESVQLSQNKYCGVTAMLAKAFPINYKVELNGALVGEGRAFPDL